MRLPGTSRPALTRRTALLGLSTLFSGLLPRLPCAADDASLPLSTLPLPYDSRARMMIEATLRPKVRALPRPRLAQDFAVQLMRSSYAVADELDFMPMDQFQKSQFIFRQREWDDYRTKLQVSQGDLTDPAYFDFISFCQYATIADGMRQGRIVFEELTDANGTSTIVSRNPSLPQSNQALPAAHSLRVGDRILDWMLERYAAAPSLKPVIPEGRPTATQLVDGIQRVADIFSVNQFSLASTVSPLPDGGGISWTLVAPANLWSGQVLQLRGDNPRNDFEAMVSLAFLRRCGVPAQYSTRFEKGTQVTHTFRWSQFAVD